MQKKGPRKRPARNVIIQLRVVRQRTAPECVTAERKRETDREREREEGAVGTSA